MKTFLALLLLAAMTRCKVIGPYGLSEGGNDGYEGGNDDYEGGHGGYEGGHGGGYESSENEDKVCYTTQQENCEDVGGENCRAIISSRQVRQCHNVTELLCGLKETIQYDIVQAVFTVQKCHQVT